MCRFYLSYGSNLSVAQMLRRCPDAVYVGTAELPGYRLLFRGSRAGHFLTIRKAEGFKVPVLVWKVTEDDEANLDAYEGYPSFYRKETMEVELLSLADGKPAGTISAFIYIMEGDREKGTPSGIYYETCREGYRRFGFDLDILEVAYRESMGRDIPDSELWELIRK